MNSEMIKLSLSANIPCGFSNSEGKIQTDAKMTDLLFKLIRTPEMKTLIEKVQTERSPFFVICHLPSDYNKAPKFTMHRLSSKEMARRLNISRITVENKLQLIYQKTDMHSACQLRQFCREKKINRYIPPQLLPAGSQFISV
ncbi:LuxR C-terminal-related transcriptional regulator [Arsenophonus sp.]|uniref:helix-turn-helix transcriptional regulator n=1 Tax=Arsenophonus sp. TaxID=1872640 RepID=UPI002857AB7A|nr:LuxR C-terminal-related transcriptional regulator [Arsenophonus sp.]MDR5617860.1 LuxR C-terminal-related transcriptional regulator [Arsenophonus sp.]